MIEWREWYGLDLKNGERGDGGKLTLHDRGLAVAEQGQTSQGYMFMHGAAVRAVSELAAGKGLAP